MLPASDQTYGALPPGTVLCEEFGDGNAQRNIEPLTSFHRRTDFIKNCVRTNTCCLLAKKKKN